MNVELLSMEQTSPITGIGRYTRCLLNHLSPRVNIRVKIMTASKMARKFSFLRYLPTGIQDHQPGSIVHFPQIMGCALLLWKSQHPCVATVHDLGPLEFPEEMHLLDPIARQILRLSLAGLVRADRIIADSEFTRQGILNHLKLPADKVITIPLAIDGNVFKPCLRARGQLIQRYSVLGAKSGPWVLYVGTELPRKNLITLLQAVAELKKIFPQLIFLKVGYSGGDRFRERTQMELQALGIEKCALFFEGISDEDLALFYAASDVSALPSRVEGFSFPVLESMACGVPVVCSNVASLPEVAGDAALMVKPEDRQGWVEAITSLLENKELRNEHVQRGFIQARAFSWDRTARATVDVYQSID